jgi:hypothetical protein
MLVLEDDVDAVTPDLRTTLTDLLLRNILPTHWQVCYLGSHEHNRIVKLGGTRPRVNAVPSHVPVTGGFAYLINRKGARTLEGLFPLTEQWDVAASNIEWGHMTRFAVGPEMRSASITDPLFTAPRSEEGRCDSNVQVHTHRKDSILSVLYALCIYF